MRSALFWIYLIVGAGFMIIGLRHWWLGQRWQGQGRRWPPRPRWVSLGLIVWGLGVWCGTASFASGPSAAEIWIHLDAVATFFALCFLIIGLVPFGTHDQRSGGTSE